MGVEGLVVVRMEIQVGVQVIGRILGIGGGGDCLPDGGGDGFPVD